MKRARKGPTLKELLAALEVEAKSLQSMHREVVTELDNLKAEEHHLNNIMQHYEAQMEALRAKSQFATTYSSPAAARDSVSD